MEKQKRSESGKKKTKQEKRISVYVGNGFTTFPFTCCEKETNDGSNMRTDANAKFNKWKMLHVEHSEKSMKNVNETKGNRVFGSQVLLNEHNSRFQVTMKMLQDKELANNVFLYFTELILGEFYRSQFYSENSIRRKERLRIKCVKSKWKTHK